MTPTIAKHFALETAILLNTNRDVRQYLIQLVQKVFNSDDTLELDKFCHMLESMSYEDNPNRLVDVTHYILCVKLMAPNEC